MTQEEFIKLEAELRAGRLDIVKSTLEKIEKKKHPRPMVVKIANLARRAGYQRYALRLLRPIVRPEKPVVPAASSEEKLEYGASLLRLGLINECYEVLSNLDENEFPEVLLYKSFCLFETWDHDQAIPLLEKYVTLINGYQLLVGKSNLALAYVVEEQFQKGKQIIEDILESADPNSHKMLIGFTYQLYAELCIDQKKSEEALGYIKKAKDLQKDSNYRYSLHIDQLYAVTKLLKKETSQDGRRDLQKVRDLAAQKKSWEVLRDCDLFEAALNGDHEMAQKLFFGTPYENYRKRILRMFRQELIVPQTYTYCPLGKPSSPDDIFDIEKGLNLKSKKKLKTGQLLHKLITILASDFYRPFKLQTLFNLLFPGEYYDPAFSPAKIYDVIRRLEAWFSSNDIPMKIVSDRQEYFLKLEKPYGIKIHTALAIQNPIDAFLKQLRDGFPDEWFSTTDVMSLTRYSRSKAKRYLKECIDRGCLGVMGTGKFTRYTNKK
jgi:tetratricopeptide (TPR) repeat protein